MTTTDTHDYEAIEAVLVEAARILTDESEINVRAVEMGGSISLTPLRDGGVPDWDEDGEMFWWPSNDDTWGAEHRVWCEEKHGSFTEWCCTLDTGLGGESTDPRAIARALERSYRDFCARRAAGDHHPDEYSSLND